MSETTPALDELVGTLLDGRYRLIAHLASGGMGAVFQAEHVGMEKRLAVKVLRPELTKSDEIVERFRREARIYASLDHPNVVRVSDFGRTSDGMLFLAMEYLEGESLRARLDREESLTPEEALPILIDVASALAIAHQRGIVHRDLKPENIQLARLQDRVVVKVLDFGIAKVLGTPAGDLTRLGSVLGTPKYIAPEQAVGLPVDARADVYALGVLAWCMLAGRHPFEGREGAQLLLAQATEPIPPLGDARPELASHPIAEVIAKACAKDADERHADGAALHADFEACVAGRAVRPRATSTAAMPVRSAAQPDPIALVRAASARGKDALVSAAGRLRDPRLREDGIRRLRGRISAATTALRTRALPAAQQAIATMCALFDRAKSRLGRDRSLPLWSFGAVAAALLVAAILIHHFGIEARAERLLAAGDAEQARVLLAEATTSDPDDPNLQLLLGRALHRVPDGATPGIQAYDRAHQLQPESIADERVLADLIDDLGREARIARAARELLIRISTPAVPPLVRIAEDGPPLARARALLLLGEMGAARGVDRMSGFAALLSQPDCGARRIAARALGELGDPEALPALEELARKRRRERKCGADEAARAIRQIEEGRR